MELSKKDNLVPLGYMKGPQTRYLCAISPVWLHWKGQQILEACCCSYLVWVLSVSDFLKDIETGYVKKSFICEQRNL